MTGLVRKIITVVLAAIFVVSTALFIDHRIDSAKSAESYREAEAIAARPRETEYSEPAQLQPEETVPTEPQMEWIVAPVEEDEYMKQLKEINLDALREVNPAVVGWIFLPGCRINYPIVQGEDNHYYLKHTWDNRENAAGAIFMESTNNPDFQDSRTILYGHNMAENYMFGPLSRYDKMSAWKRYPYVYLVTDEGVLRYEIYSCYKAETDSGTYALDLEDERYRAAFINLTKEDAYYETNIVPALTDRLLTLSTCVGDAAARRVVHARLPMIQVEIKTDSPQAESLQ